MDKYKEHYLSIVDNIKSLGHTLTREWLQIAIDYDKANRKEKIDWQEIHQEVANSILACDLAIFECTESSFSIGYQIALALEKRKPILILSLENAERDLNDTFISGIATDIVSFRKYNKDTLNGILEEFFIENERGGEKFKFNFYLDKNLENYLDWASYYYKKSKADILYLIPA